MKLSNIIYGENNVTASSEEEKKLLDKKRFLRIFYDVVFLLGWAACLPVGTFPGYGNVFSAFLVLCIVISFFDENFYLYAALFMYMRYKMLIGDSPAFRIYSYLVVLKFLIDLPKTKFKVTYLPALFVFALHSIFATSQLESMRVALNVIVDVALAYIILLQVTSNTTLLRKFMFAFLLGGVLSAVYGWTDREVSVDINVAGAGAQTVSRNFGALSDSNFAGLFYSLCIIISLTLKNVPLWLKGVFTAIFGIVLLQTASLSAIITLAVLGIFVIILKYRMKSIFILLFGFVAVCILLGVLLSIPQVRQIEAVQGLIIRVSEKLSYIPRGRWDLLTTDRWAIWTEALNIFFSKSLWGQLIGGSVITVMTIDYSVISIACHNSYIQSLLNFGILGTIMIYIPLFATFAYRMSKHFMQKAGYEDEDVKTIQLACVFAFIFFGFTVDFFIDWAFMVFYFI